ncbi:MAG: tail fiber protein [Bryobacterales bacterium]|nr:tail fiber protein [Bryobacterales bacterium]
MPYIGEIQIYAGASDALPEGWALCDGSLVAVSAYADLFSLIGYTYGGSGGTFALPDMTGRIPIGSGQGPGLTMRTVGESGGSDTVTLTVAELPAHSHALLGAQSPPAQPNNGDLAGALTYTAPNATPLVALAAESLDPTPGQPANGHPNDQPALRVNFMISLTGAMPA